MNTILVVGDVHGNRPYFKHVIKQATKLGCDAILQVGDFGYWPHTDPQFLGQVTRDLMRYDEHREKRGLRPLSLFWIDGNHDCFSGQVGALFETEWPTTPEGFWQMSPRVFYLPRGVRWTWSGVRFVALGGGASIDKQWRLSQGPPGVYWWPEETIRQRDVYRAIEGGTADVLVAHDMPEGTKLPFQLLKVGPEHDQNRMAVRTVADAVKPARIYHGHYHVANRFILDGDGYRAEVVGLDMDDTYERNYVVLDLGEFKRTHARRFT